MKRLILVLALSVGLVGTVWAKTLTNPGITPASDSVYTAVVGIDAEITKIYAYLNTLFKLQAQASAPTGNSTYDVWIDTSSTPALKYYDGSVWQTLVNPSAYSSGLTFANASVGYMENCTLAQDAATKSAMIDATATLPCTVEDDGDLLQVAAKITYDFTDVAEDIYYVKPVQTGTTTAFTLDVDTVKAAGTNYLGEVHTNGSAGVIESVIDYSATKYENAKTATGLFHTYRTSSEQDVVAAYYKFLPDAVAQNTDGALSDSRFLPTRAGWYEINSTISVADETVAVCVDIRYPTSSTTAARRCTVHSESVNVSAYLYFDGVDDYAEIFFAASSPTTTEYLSSFSSAFWGRWLGRNP